MLWPTSRVSRSRSYRAPANRWRNFGDPVTYTLTSSAIGDVTLLVGAEREGLPDEVVAGADHLAHIPIQSDSLNAAMAAAIALYELSRRMAPE